MKYRTIILITLLATLSAIFSAAINWLFQLFTVGIIYFFATIFILSKDVLNPKIVKLILLASPFTLIYGSVFFINPNPNLKVIPILVMPVLSCLAAYLCFLLNNNRLYIVFYTFLICLLSFIGMPNWINFVADDENPINKLFPELEIRDVNDKPFTFKNNKVVVIDLWSTSCGVCIKKFPDFEKLKLKYKEDNRVEFYSLNLPLKRDTDINVKNYVKDYKFKSIFALELDSWEKLDNRTVPKILILNKSNHIVYKGFMNDKWYEYYNNINDLIEKHTNE